MTTADRRQVAKVVLPGLIAGGACGAGVGSGLYPAAVGIAGAITIAVDIGIAVYQFHGRRLRRDSR